MSANPEGMHHKVKKLICNMQNIISIRYGVIISYNRRLLLNSLCRVMSSIKSVIFAELNHRVNILLYD